jgi:peptidoglycan/xylan/chitin deacetylase (PgdA/CDA1 family)
MVSEGLKTVLASLRQTGRSLVLQALSLRKFATRLQPGIRFVCYHDVLPQETASLESQLLLIKQHGDFISIDRAIELMAAGAPLDKPLFVVTFDDGLETTHRQAWPVFERLGIPFSVYIITSLPGRSGYIDWKAIADMARSPLVTFGSHTVNHRNLSQLSASEVRSEMADSKARLEAELGVECAHFCCPWGRPGRDFKTERDPAIAVDVGYRSFLTTERGLTRTGDRLPMVKRDVIHMHSSSAELRHFLF